MSARGRTAVRYFPAITGQPIVRDRLVKDAGNSSPCPLCGSRGEGVADVGPVRLTKTRVGFNCCGALAVDEADFQALLEDAELERITRTTAAELASC
jgi:hypothetical protein